MSVEEVESWDFVKEFGFSETPKWMPTLGLDYGEMFENLPIEIERTLLLKTDFSNSTFQIKVEKTLSFFKNISSLRFSNKKFGKKEFINPDYNTEEMKRFREVTRKFLRNKIWRVLLQNYLENGKLDSWYDGLHFSFFLRESGIATCRCDAPIIQMKKIDKSNNEKKRSSHPLYRDDF